MFIKPVAFINVEERKLEWAEPMTWHTPTIAKMDKIPLYTKPNDEPAAWFYYRLGETGKFMCADAEAMKGIEKDGWITTPLYLHPVKELTDDEIADLIKATNDETGFGHIRIFDFVKVLLRKARE
jgi:hypothetical protein